MDLKSYVAVLSVYEDKPVSQCSKGFQMLWLREALMVMELNKDPGRHCRESSIQFEVEGSNMNVLRFHATFILLV